MADMIINAALIDWILALVALEGVASGVIDVHYKANRHTIH
jgi:hypothetical protein